MHFSCIPFCILSLNTNSYICLIDIKKVKEYNTLARNLYPLTERDSVQEILDEFQSVAISGNYGYIRTESNVNRSAMSFYTGTDYLPEQVTILEWVDGNYEFQLYGEEISAEELIRMAESVQPE